jgi:GNAT superfamily N-acetyltransferase
MKQTMEFEGPRRIRAEERQGGYDLFEICFGHKIPMDPEEPVSEAELSNWYVMVPREGPFMGKPVSQIGIFHSQVQIGGSRLRVGSIGGVCTHPDFRNLGLAGQVLGHCARQLKEEGARLMLISGGRGLYTRTGNVEAMRLNFVGLSANLIHELASWPQVTVRQSREDDRSILAKLYQMEPVSFIRLLEEYPDPLNPDWTWIIELDGTPVAYVLKLPWDNEPGDFIASEYAGSRLALAAGLSRMLSDLDGPAKIHKITIGIPWQDQDLLQLLVAMGADCSHETLYGHTMRLINFPALLGDLEDYIAARLPESLRTGLRFEQAGPLLEDPGLPGNSDDRCAIVLNGSRLELSTAQMTRLVMGDWEEATSRDLPCGETLREVVRSLFPLPSFLPGLNYR